MNLARVTGSVWMTERHPAYAGRKLLTVRIEGDEREVLAIDLVAAGAGDRVLLMEEGNGARQLLGDDAAPIRSVIVGVVDGIQVA